MIDHNTLCMIPNRRYFALFFTISNSVNFKINFILARATNKNLEETSFLHLKES